MKKKIFLLLIIILTCICCKRNVSEQNKNILIVDEKIENTYNDNIIEEEKAQNNRFFYNLIVPDTMENVILSNIMFPEEILSYRSVLDNLISKEDHIIAKLELKSGDRFQSNKYNYYLRQRIELAAATPLTGFTLNIDFSQDKCMIILEEDVPLYKVIFGENGGLSRIEKTELWLSAGSVIEISPTSPFHDGFIYFTDYILEKLLDGRYVIHFNDIKMLKTLSDRVVYKIINGLCYRFITLETGELTDRIGNIISPIINNENGSSYIRNEGFRWQGFYLWEQVGDYYFDNEGNFIERTRLGPDWTGH
jgi:hypothetical protein